MESIIQAANHGAEDAACMSAFDAKPKFKLTRLWARKIDRLR